MLLLQKQVVREMIALAICGALSVFQSHISALSEPQIRTLEEKRILAYHYALVFAPFPRHGNRIVSLPTDAPKRIMSVRAFQKWLRPEMPVDKCETIWHNRRLLMFTFDRSSGGGALCVYLYVEASRGFDLFAVANRTVREEFDWGWPASIRVDGSKLLMSGSRGARRTIATFDFSEASESLRRLLGGRSGRPIRMRPGPGV